MKEEAWTLFPFLTMDYKAAEGWLNQKAADIAGPLDWTATPARSILEEKFGATTGGHHHV